MDDKKKVRTTLKELGLEDGFNRVIDNAYRRAEKYCKNRGITDNFILVVEQRGDITKSLERACKDIVEMEKEIKELRKENSEMFQELGYRGDIL